MLKNFLLSLSLLLMSCSTSSALNLSEINSNQTIKTHINEEITISLKGNPTTGYKWQFTSSNGTYFKVLEESYQIDKHPSGMVGVGGHFIYRFKPIKKGTFAINAKYYRPWEEFNPEADKQYNFNFEVE